MNKKLFFSLFLLVALTAALPLYAANPPAPTGEKVLKVADGQKAKRDSVKFWHSKGHKDIACVQCHHVVENGQPVFKSCNADGCHNNYAARKGPDSYYAAFHSPDKRSCLGCHRVEFKAGNKNAGTKCASCHTP